MIYLVLSTEENDIESSLIRRLTMCAWSHVGFYREEDGYIFSAMNDGKGVEWRPPNPKAKTLVLSVPHAEDALSLALTKRGDAYDTRDIVGFIVNRDWQSPNEFICDRLVFWAFDAIGQPLLNHAFIPIEHLTPRDVLLSPLVSVKQ